MHILHVTYYLKTEEEKGTNQTQEKTEEEEERKRREEIRELSHTAIGRPNLSYNINSISININNFQWKSTDINKYQQQS